MSVQAGQPGGVIVFPDRIWLDEEHGMIVASGEFQGYRILMLLDASELEDLLKQRKTSWALDPL